ncbi:hypothetical protein KR026_007130 [Drosophila bipectinata]|nr:hypothetical protein KR026_007130 [Drosophila bipectinata]
MENYSHKKFTGALKRKRSQDEESDDDVVFVMEQPGQRTPEQSQSKRTRFFRPWLDESQPEKKQPQPPKKIATIAATPASVRKMDATYHPNMVRSHKRRQRSPQEQLRRDRNTLASLRHRRSQQQQQQLIEQQYLSSRIQHEANLEQQIRLSLYYVRFLQQTMATMEPLPPTHYQQVPRFQATTTTQHP